MSIESAKAFCVRLMADDEFRDALGAASTSDMISKLVADNGYTFTQHDLLKVVSDLSGKKIEAEQLVSMICEVYEEEIKGENGTGSVDAVAEWLHSLQ